MKVLRSEQHSKVMGILGLHRHFRYLPSAMTSDWWEKPGIPTPWLVHFPITVSLVKHLGHLVQNRGCISGIIQVTENV